ncbi:peptidyl-prolyl cis-trans isomerase, EpsD family, partial [bacterium]|nr:peptidyl-prolyl cis-trans isomerase, EpsD family [bacterium]
LFIITEGERAILNSLVDVKDAPLSLEAVAPQIEQLLANQKSKEATDAELGRLRASAKIEYFNPKTGAAEPVKPVEPAKTGGTAVERGVAGLK